MDGCLWCRGVQIYGNMLQIDNIYDAVHLHPSSVPLHAILLTGVMVVDCMLFPRFWPRACPSLCAEYQEFTFLVNRERLVGKAKWCCKWPRVNHLLVSHVQCSLGPRGLRKSNCLHCWIHRWMLYHISSIRESAMVVLRACALYSNRAACYERLELYKHVVKVCNFYAGCPDLPLGAWKRCTNRNDMHVCIFGSAVLLTGRHFPWKHFLATLSAVYGSTFNGWMDHIQCTMHHPAAHCSQPDHTWLLFPFNRTQC